MHKTIKGKQFTWYHFPQLEEADFEMLEKKFKFHPLDFDDLRVEANLQKVDVYKYYLFSILNIPIIDKALQRVVKQTLAIFIGKSYVVTATREPIESVDRFFARAVRSSGLRRDALGKSTGYFLYKLFDYLSRDKNIVLKELVHETEQVEVEMYERHSKLTTKRLSILRRNILFLRHIIDPQRIIISQFIHARKTFIPKTLEIYFDDVKDSLDGIWVVTENLKNIVDGLSDVNEAFISHRTNQIIRILTVISVVLLPPTLITSYYGMNVQGLPFSENTGLISLILLISLIISWLLIIGIDRRK
ncbi:magnesium transporter CorA family protein [Patescibacteria group bacterium]|nr:magnesium transporter CorA family protein [Patescibacteria group bacterium]